MLDVVSVRFGTRMAMHHPFKYKTTAADKTILMWSRGINYSQYKTGKLVKTEEEGWRFPGSICSPGCGLCDAGGRVKRGSVDVALREFGN